jgi:hypothetical protein
VFLDCDEFLTWARVDGSFTQTADMVAELSRVAPQEAIAGIWLDNVAGYDDRFILYHGRGRWPVGVAGGKPIISSKAHISGFINHNFQLDLFENTQNANFLVLHMKRLLPRQRIRANISKLRNYRFLAESEGLDRIAATDVDALPAGNVRQWVSEVQELSKQVARGPGEEGPLDKGQVRLAANSRLEFHSADERGRFLAFLRKPGPAVRQVIRNKVKRYRASGGTLGRRTAGSGGGP